MPTPIPQMPLLVARRLHLAFLFSRRVQAVRARGGCGRGAKQSILLENLVHPLAQGLAAGSGSGSGSGVSDYLLLGILVMFVLYFMMQDSNMNLNFDFDFGEINKLINENHLFVIIGAIIFANYILM